MIRNFVYSLSLLLIPLAIPIVVVMLILGLMVEAIDYLKGRYINLGI